MKGLTISIDTGGTFTDVVVADENKNFTIGKALTSHDRVFLGVHKALASVAKKLDTSVANLLRKTQLVIYGTTHATNAIVTQRTAKTAFLTTAGFPDILVMREGGKFDPHDFSREFPRPYISRRNTFEIDERVTSTGLVYKSLERSQVNDVIHKLREGSFEACAICLIWSTVNNVHEKQLGEWLGDALPDLAITLSHQLNPILREYRRASSTAIDASVKPAMQKHLLDLQDDFRKKGFEGQLLVSSSNGGCMDVEAASKRPIHTVRSGPAMAPVAGKACAELERCKGPIVVVDTGGTTFDVSLIVDGDISITTETWIGERFTGHMLGLPAVDARSVGSGGGSIAWIDDGGLLRIGPQSAGARPGPACYGTGGDLPTVTDAAVVLGYIDPNYFLAGEMKLDRGAALKAVGGLANQLKVSVSEAAFSILTVSNESMINAIKDMTVREGVDPTEAVIVAGGGAAGLGIITIAKELGCKTVIIPRSASVLSASGMQYSDIQYEHATMLPMRSSKFSHARVNQALDTLDLELTDFSDRLSSKGFSSASISYRVDAKYAAQVWDIPIKLPFQRFQSSESVDELVELFHANHQRVFNITDRSSSVEFTNWIGTVTVEIPKTETRIRKTDVKSENFQRPAYFDPNETLNTQVLRGENFSVGTNIRGPAIIEEPTTTIVLPPKASLTLSESANYVVQFSSS
ncbi:hydantoinase/oxoprolinase family protein [Gammaproteobacteria bacterium]|nr:hydantoinase/oxoprolinase family protein [Gammaproteobacteria bacterium]